MEQWDDVQSAKQRAAQCHGEDYDYILAVGQSNSLTAHDMV